MALHVNPERTNRELAALLPHPALDANKYTRGHLYLIAGSSSYPGAACLAGAAAEKAGAGYVEVYSAESSVPTVRGWRPSLVVRSWDVWQPDSLSAPTLHHPAAGVVGCGFDANDAESRVVLMETVRTFPAPLLVDGGGLSLLASPEGHRAAIERARMGQPLVLTPHGGEASRLLEAVHCHHTESPAAAAAEIARTYRAVVALKGPDTYLATWEGRNETMTRGTSALAKAGTGDVLAGIIGALMAQGIAALSAASLGCALHAEAGRIAAKALTDICVTAEDVITRLPDAIRIIESAK